jgi:AraC-like DNA-binding protein
MHDAREKLHKSPDVSLTLASGGTHSAARGEDFPEHKHTDWELVYYRTGRIQCPVGAEVYEGTPGLLLLTPPDTAHAEIASTAYSNYFVVAEVQGDPQWPIVIYDDPAIGLQSLFAAIVRELNGSRPYSELMLPLLAEQLVIMLQRAELTSTASTAESLVVQAESLIDEQYRMPLRVMDIATELGCSPSLLRSSFAKQRSTSPRAHLQSVRLKNALAMLRSSTLTLESIADMCGFDSASHLSRCVKYAAGTSPGRLRRESSS